MDKFVIRSPAKSKRARDPDATDTNTNTIPDQPVAKKIATTTKKEDAKVPSKAKKTTVVTAGKTKAPSDHPNKDITDILLELGRNEAAMGQKFKASAYRKAANVLSLHGKRIENGKEALALPGIGKKIAAKIDEILTTGKLNRLERDQADPTIQALRLLKSVSGVGPKAAAKYVEQGITTLDQLRQQPGLSHHIQMGLQYYDDWAEKIPRSEMVQLEQRLHEIIEASGNASVQGLTLTICGSYRRGKSESGDIDILLTKEGVNDKKVLAGILTHVIAVLKKAKFLVDDLTTEHANTKYMGTCRLDSDHKCRRIDIRVLPYESYYPGVLYFTGSDEFNKNMRLHAIEAGFHLSEYALSSVGSKSKVEIPVTSEQEIFDILGMEFVKPEDRSIDGSK